MEARVKLVAKMATLAALVQGLLIASSLSAAEYATTNFRVQAPTPALAKEIGDHAEHWRAKLSKEWIGQKMPDWSRPCPITAQVAPHLGAGGATSFIFDHGEVFGWEMNIQGPRERVLDSVLPHEVTHTIFACYFRRPLPRWADEGACTTVEHESEIGKQERMLLRFLKTGKGIPFSAMFAMKEYPPDVLPLYAQGHSLTQFLLMHRGKAAFLDFLADGMKDENWPRAVQSHYGHPNLYALQTAWLDWVRQGRPRLTPAATAPPALASTQQPRSADPSAFRGQSPDSVVQVASSPTPAPGAATSVYVAAATRAAAKRDQAPDVHDASRPTGTISR